MKTGRRRTATATAQDLDLQEGLDLSIGPNPPLTDVGLAYLQALWAVVGEAFLPSQTCPNGATNAAPFPARRGYRPWAWWAFTADEPRPSTPGAEFYGLRALGVLPEWEQTAALEGLRQQVVPSRGMGAAAIAAWLGLDVQLVTSWFEDAATPERDTRG